MVLLEILEHGVTDLFRVRRRADDRDGSRFEQGGKHGVSVDEDGEKVKEEGTGRGMQRQTRRRGKRKNRHGDKGTRRQEEQTGGIEQRILL